MSDEPKNLNQDMRRKTLQELHDHYVALAVNGSLRPNQRKKYNKLIELAEKGTVQPLEIFENNEHKYM